MKTKGQSAMEYLMTYGWAILVVVAVIGALYAMGIFRSGEIPVKCSPCFSYFAYIDYSNGVSVLRNGVQRINITSITGESISGGDCILNAECTSGENIRIQNIATTGDQTTTINYTTVDSGLAHLDTAVIRN